MLKKFFKSNKAKDYITCRELFNELNKASPSNNDEENFFTLLGFRKIIMPWLYEYDYKKYFSELKV